MARSTFLLPVALIGLAACSGGSGTSGISPFADPVGASSAATGETFAMNGSTHSVSSDGHESGLRNGTITRLNETQLQFTSDGDQTVLTFDEVADGFIGTLGPMDVTLRVMDGDTTHHALIMIEDQHPLALRHTFGVVGAATPQNVMNSRGGLAGYGGVSILSAASEDGSGNMTEGAFSIVANFNTDQVFGTVFTGGGLSISLSDGQIAGNQISAGIESVQVDGFSGSASGNFFGPNAEGIGGTFTGEGSVDGTDVTLSGTYYGHD